MIKEATQNRQIKIGVQIGDLAHERLEHTRRIDEIDKILGSLEAHFLELEQVKRDLGTEEAILKAQTPEE